MSEKIDQVQAAIDTVFERAERSLKAAHDSARISSESLALVAIADQLALSNTLRIAEFAIASKEIP